MAAADAASVSGFVASSSMIRRISSGDGVENKGLTTCTTARRLRGAAVWKASQPPAIKIAVTMRRMMVDLPAPVGLPTYFLLVMTAWRKVRETSRSGESGKIMKSFVCPRQVVNDSTQLRRAPFKPT